TGRSRRSHGRREKSRDAEPRPNAGPRPAYRRTSSHAAHGLLATPHPMDPLNAGITLAVIVGVLGFLIFSSLGADAILAGGLAIVVVFGVVDTKTAVAGFANEGMLT